jgi:hypothetical protein
MGPYSQRHLTTGCSGWAAARSTAEPRRCVTYLVGVKPSRNVSRDDEGYVLPGDAVAF